MPELRVTERFEHLEPELAEAIAARIARKRIIAGAVGARIGEDAAGLIGRRERESDTGLERRDSGGSPTTESKVRGPGK